VTTNYNASYLQMATNTTYPTASGISVGFKSANTSMVENCLMKWSLVVGGTPGTSPSYTIQVLNPLGNWVNTGTALSATGQSNGIAFGSAVRLNASNGTSPGTGNNTPKYRLDVEKLHYRDSGVQLSTKI